MILHCAGSANVGASVVNPMADLDGNLHSLYQLLLALKSFEKRPEIIFLSSAGVYGNPRQLPVRESDVAAPMSPYGLHKHMGEELCEYYNRIHGYHIRSIRIFSAYGNGLRKQLLWDIYQKYQNTGRIELFGTGEETRDFIHVSDIMRAIDLILSYDGTETVINVANGEEVSIRELAEIYADSLSKTLDCTVCITDTDQVIAAAGNGKKELQEMLLSAELAEVFQERKTVLKKSSDAEFVAITKDRSEYSEEIISAILSEGDIAGGVIFLQKNEKKHFGEMEKKFAAGAADLLGRQLS